MFVSNEKVATPNSNPNGADLRNKADGVMREVKHDVEAISDDLQRAANSAGAAVRNVTEKAVAETSRATNDVIGYVRANPMQSSLMTLGVGFVLGALLMRK